MRFTSGWPWAISADVNSRNDKLVGGLSFTALYAASFKGNKDAVKLLLAQPGGIYPDARPNVAGIGTVLALRSKYATPPKVLNDSARYIDLRFYDKAFPR